MTWHSQKSDLFNMVLSVSWCFPSFIASTIQFVVTPACALLTHNIAPQLPSLPGWCSAVGNGLTTAAATEFAPMPNVHNLHNGKSARFCRNCWQQSDFR